MAIDSYSKFKEYCLRRLGKDVIEIEMSDLQIKDRIDDALQKFTQRHYDGSEAIWVRHNLTYADAINGYTTVTGLNTVVDIMMPSRSSFRENVEVFDDLEFRFYQEYASHGGFAGSGMLVDWHVNMEYLATMRFMLNVKESFSFNGMSNRIYFNDKINAFSAIYALPKLASGSWTENNTVMTHLDAPLANGDLEASTLTFDGVGPGSIVGTYETPGYLRGKFTAIVYLMAGTYAGAVKLSLKDRNGTLIGSKTLTPNPYWTYYLLEGEATNKIGHINDLVVTIETVSTPGADETLFIQDNIILGRNGFILLQGYRETVPDDYDSIWNVQWLKDYATALLRLQWGHNLNKYDGILLPGGVTLKGQDLISEAQEEITKLEEDLELKYTFPVDFMVG